MISKAAKQRKIERARIDLQRLCPKGTTIFSIERTRTDFGVTLDFFIVKTDDNGKQCHIRLNGFISDANLFRLTSKHFIRVGGSQFSHSWHVISSLAAFVWGDDKAFNMAYLG
jgi:hypothetical protein